MNADEAPTRRCWRCLQMFPRTAEDLLTDTSGWWLCDPCHAALIPAKTGTGTTRVD